MGITSDNACANALGVGRAAVSRWRNGDGHPDPGLVEDMCKATGESVAHWLPLIEAERATSPKARQVWLRLAQAAAVIALMASLHRSGAHAQLALLFAAHNPGGLYIM
ncbi:helix-turn-helix domain-containing protein [Dyella choica]